MQGLCGAEFDIFFVVNKKVSPVILLIEIDEYMRN